MLVSYEIARVPSIVMVIEIDLICSWYSETIHTSPTTTTDRAPHNVGTMRLGIVHYRWSRGGLCER